VHLIRNVMKTWLVCAIVITLLSGLVYVTAKIELRGNRNPAFAAASSSHGMPAPDLDLLLRGDHCGKAKPGQTSCLG
jgi:hypothetical protein